MRIGELSRRTGVSTRALRYYEGQDLLHPVREANGYRTYPEGSVDRVRQIRELVLSGLPTRVIRNILPCVRGPEADPQPCAVPDVDMVAMLTAELRETEERIHYLTLSRNALRRYLAVLEAPADPA
ncbi:MerR family transcriptional regulator [Saccharopolyspora erythraea]|uniref:MerR family transcriptional regulator n=1 Tax=Saccharopolyspora erythraea TaxID=1836 RepID=UPI001BA7E84A|nr:MerR family transcriptional regulator [Saccharopolyspora erythraea]QUH01815.1 MerR family transcriptional regulator [Saccharopolyspora erythraea]